MVVSLRSRSRIGGRLVQGTAGQSSYVLGRNLIFEIFGSKGGMRQDTLDPWSAQASWEVRLKGVGHACETGVLLHAALPSDAPGAWAA